MPLLKSPGRLRQTGLREGQAAKPMYTIVGSGRLARHFAYYLLLEEIGFSCWSRKVPEPPWLKENWVPDLGTAVRDSSHVLLLISDPEIEPFIRSHPGLKGKQVVHCSGSLYSSLAPGAHPLMTFTEGLYDLETYHSFSFILEEGGPGMAALLPGLPNRSFLIKPELKPLYHSLCVLSGNFTSILWGKFFKELEQTFDVPHEAALPYLDRITRNLHSPAVPALTGPLARRDFDTIQKNLEALSADSFKAVYAAFVEACGLADELEARKK